jgi:hypothetical protein
MPNKKEPDRIAARLAAEVAKVAADSERRATEADKNVRAFLADYGGAPAGKAGRYAVYRDRRCEAIYPTFIEAAMHLGDKNGFPASIHEITTQDEPAFLRRKPPIV